MRAVSRGRLLLFLVLAAGGVGVDLATKAWIFRRLGMPHQNPTWWLIDGVFGFTTSLNEGALFGVGQGRGMLFSALSLVALVGIVTWLFAFRAAHDRLLTVALGLVSGGILGNLYDRLGLPGLVRPGAAGERLYAVRDWLHFKIDGVVDWPIFNIADCLLVCGAALLLWHSVRGEPPRPVDAVED